MALVEYSTQLKSLSHVVKAKIPPYQFQSILLCWIELPWLSDKNIKVNAHASLL